MTQLSLICSRCYQRRFVNVAVSLSDARLPFSFTSSTARFSLSTLFRVTVFFHSFFSSAYVSFLSPPRQSAESSELLWLPPLSWNRPWPNDSERSAEAHFRFWRRPLRPWTRPQRATPRREIGWFSWQPRPGLYNKCDWEHQ